MENEEPKEVSWTEAREAVQHDIDYAIAAFNFFEELDVNSPLVLQLNMKDEIIDAMRDCLEILCSSLKELNDGE